jgi:DNA-binding response OmpR family regulator
VKKRFMPRPYLLLVDDSPEIAFIVKRFAKAADQEVTSCRTVEEAWDWLKNGSQKADLDLILLDMHLPGASGLELCRRLRDDVTVVSGDTITSPSPLYSGESGENTTPIAILSDWQRRDEIASALEAGANYVLEKDLLCHPNQWQERLKEILHDAHHRHFDSNIRLSEHGLSPDSPELAQACFDRALKRLAASRLGSQVLRVLLIKALARSFTKSEGNHASLPCRLGSAGPGIEWEKVSPNDRPALANACWAELAREGWCVMGSDFTKLLDEALKDPTQA